MNHWNVNDAGFLSDRLALPAIYSWIVSIVARAFNFSCLTLVNFSC